MGLMRAPYFIAMFVIVSMSLYVLVCAQAHVGHESVNGRRKLWWAACEFRWFDLVQLGMRMVRAAGDTGMAAPGAACPPHPTAPIGAFILYY